MTSNIDGSRIFAGDVSQEEFLRDYWQQKPLLIRNAFPDFQSPITAEELAGLACEEDVNARLVIEKDAEIELAKLKVIANDTDREAQKELNDLLAQREDIQAQGTKQQTLLLKKQNTVKAEGGDTPEKFEAKRLELSEHVWHTMRETDSREC